MGFLKDKFQEKLDKEADRAARKLGNAINGIIDDAGRELGDTPRVDDPSALVPDPNDMRYPLEQDTYKATVTFTVMEEVSTGTSPTITDTANKQKDDEKAIEDAVNERIEGGEDLESKGIIDTVKDYAKQFDQMFNVSDAVKPKKVVLGKSVTMYLPLGLTFNDNVAYNNVQLGAFGATMETGLGIAQSMTSGINSFIENFKAPDTPNGGDLAKLGAIALTKKIPSLAAEAGMVAKLTGGVTLNPNERVLFEQPNIREFAFTFKMIARSKAEQAQVNAIIKHLRSELYPEEIEAPVGNGKTISLGYRFPNKFDIKFHYDGKKIPALANMQPCFLQGVDTVYNATQMAFHGDGNFMEVDMTLRFKETRALTKPKVQEGF